MLYNCLHITLLLYIKSKNCPSIIIMIMHFRKGLAKWLELLICSLPDIWSGVSLDPASSHPLFLKHETLFPLCTGWSKMDLIVIQLATKVQLQKLCHNQMKKNYKLNHMQFLSIINVHEWQTSNCLIWAFVTIYPLKFLRKCSLSENLILMRCSDKKREVWW